MARGRGGFIGQDGLNAPDSPTGVSGTAGNTTVSVAFTAPTDVGGSAITGYNVQSNDGSGTWQSFYDLTGAAYDSVNFSVSGQDADPYGLFFRSDGAKMYVAGDAGNDINEYNLSTPWTVSSASYSQNFSVASQESAPNGVFFKTDGTKMFVVGTATDTVYEYALSSAWDISSASYGSVSFSVGSQDTVPTDISFNTDGTKMFIVGNTGNNVYEYALSSAWVVSSASYTRSFSLASQETGPTGLFFSSDGLNMVVVGASGVNKYVLTSAFDISSASHSQAFSVSSQENDPQALFFKSDGTKMYVLGSGSDTVYQYTTGDVDYPTASPVTVTGLTNGTSYTFNVWAINAFGYSAPSDASTGVSPSAPQVAVFGHSNAGLDQFNMATEGSVTDFGTISIGESTGRGAVGSATRGVFGGGQDSNVITYITFSSAGNGTDFGDQGEAANGQSGMGNSTRGIFSGGAWDGSTNKNFMDYITIASTGNSTTFGNLTQGRRYLRGCASPTRGLNGSGYQSSFTGRIDYVTIASTGNATTFGTLSPTYVGYAGAACSSSTRAIWAGGSSGNIANNISYVTIASTGNSTDFGDLTENKYNIAGCTNSTTAYFFGGQGSSGAVQNIDKITIASTGNATDTGVNVKTTSSSYGMAASGSHGGIS